VSAPGGFAPRKILVALDLSRHGRAALDVAVDLAGRLHSELEGLFVEDADLLRLACSPFAHHVTVPFGVSEPLETRWVEADLSTHAARARGTLESAARRRRVRFTFRSVRGRVTTEILQAAGGADLLVLGWSCGSVSVGSRMGGTARAAVEKAAPSVLLLREGTRVGSPVFAVLEQSDRVLQIVDAAVQLAKPSHRPATLILVAGTPEAAFALRDRARDHLQALGEDAVYRSLVGPSVASLQRALEGVEAGLVLIPAETRLQERVSLTALLDGVRTSLLLLR